MLCPPLVSIICPRMSHEFVIGKGFGGNKKNKNNPKEYYGVEEAYANCKFDQGVEIDTTFHASNMALQSHLMQAQGKAL